MQRLHFVKYYIVSVIPHRQICQYYRQNNLPRKCDLIFFVYTLVTFVYIDYQLQVNIYVNQGTHLHAVRVKPDSPRCPCYRRVIIITVPLTNETPTSFFIERGQYFQASMNGGESRTSVVSMCFLNCYPFCKRRQEIGQNCKFQIIF